MDLETALCRCESHIAGHFGASVDDIEMLTMLRGRVSHLERERRAALVELEIATKLYAKARKISIEEAADNIRDARLNREEAAK